MTLRDLSNDEVVMLQKLCMSEFEVWKKRVGIRPASREEVWQAAWSNALKARLQLTKKDELCEAVETNGIRECTKTKGHEGPHDWSRDELG